jgi:S-adenosylmethionine:tRNA ribosyltransferase-isomerase
LTKNSNIKGLEEFDFELPRELIAQEPVARRGDSRLLVLKKDSGKTFITSFSMLHEHLPAGSLLVFNDAKVSPARLFGECEGARVELLILEPPGTDAPQGSYTLWCLGRPGKKLRAGKNISFGKSGFLLAGRVLEEGGRGERLISFEFRDKPLEVLAALGHLPLPPYIKRPDRREDFERYQTVFAKTYGAVAAPTAGLHFTEEYARYLEEKGFSRAMLFIKVGAGTFMPLTEAELDSGKLHKERVLIGEGTADKINLAKSNGVPIVSVGTTALRALEWAGSSGKLEAVDGVTDIFIRPGFDFKIADALLTNFHLPQSSLFILVSAFAGAQRIKDAYELAIKNKFRFYSYGDAMLIV